MAFLAAYEATTDRNLPRQGLPGGHAIRGEESLYRTKLSAGANQGIEFSLPDSFAEQIVGYVSALQQRLREFAFGLPPNRRLFACQATVENESQELWIGIK